MVVDLQGILAPRDEGFTLSDPVILCTDLKRFGTTNFAREQMGECLGAIQHALGGGLKRTTERTLVRTVRAGEGWSSTVRCPCPSIASPVGCTRRNCGGRCDTACGVRAVAW